MTIKEVLEMVVKNLSEISVPVALTQQIAMPVSQAIENVKACLEAMARQDQAAGQQQESQEPEETDE